MSLEAHVESLPFEKQFRLTIRLARLALPVWENYAKTNECYKLKTNNLYLIMADTKFKYNPVNYKIEFIHYNESSLTPNDNYFSYDEKSRLKKCANVHNPNSKDSIYTEDKYIINDSSYCITAKGNYTNSDIILYDKEYRIVAEKEINSHTATAKISKSTLSYYSYDKENRVAEKRELLIDERSSKIFSYIDAYTYNTNKKVNVFLTLEWYFTSPLLIYRQ